MGIATDSLRTYLFRVATLLTSFATGIMTARFLGPVGKGTYALALLISTLYTNVFGNLGGAIIYQLTRLKKEPRPILFTASVYSWVIGLLTIAGYLVFIKLFPDRVVDYLWPVVLNAPLVLAATNLNGFFMGLNRVKFVNWLGFIPGLLLLLLLGVGFFGYRIGVVATLECWVAAQLVTVTWGYWIIRKYWRGGEPFYQTVQPDLLKTMLKFGWQLGLVNLISFLNYRIDMFLVEGFLGREKLGFYSIAVSLAELLWFTSTAIATASYARIGLADRSEAGQLTAKAARHTLYINLLLGVLLWVGVELMLTVIYGEVYRPALAPFRILLPGVLAYGLAGIFSTYFANQLGKPKYALMIAAMSMVVNLLCCLILIPRIGIAGGAWATTISYLIAIVILMVIFIKKSELSFSDLLRFSKADRRDYALLFGNILSYLGRKQR